MSVKRPFLSVLIPTRNRANYVKYAIESALRIASEDLEIIVSENHGEDEGWNICQGYSDPRLSVFQPDRPLPMHENFEYLLKLSTGQWITYLGDDDAIMPHAVEHLRYLASRYTYMEALVSPRAYYYWEGIEEEYGDQCVSFKVTTLERWRDSKRQLRYTLLGDMPYVYLPQMYSGGFHRRSLVNRVLRAQNGTYFKSVTPDAYAALMACLHTYRYLETGVPMTWVGSSPHQALVKGAANAKDRDKDFFGMHSSESLAFHEALGVKPVIDFHLFFFESYISAFPMTSYAELNRDRVRSVCDHVLSTMKRTGRTVDDRENFAAMLGFGSDESVSPAESLSRLGRSIAARFGRTYRKLGRKLNKVVESSSTRKIASYVSRSHQKHPNILTMDDQLSEAYSAWKAAQRSYQTEV